MDIGAYESLYGGVNMPADLDGDCDVDGDDLIVFESCTTGPTIAYNPTGLPPGCTLVPIDGIISADVDRDGDVDQTDFGRFQRCLAGSGQLVDPHCSE